MKKICCFDSMRCREILIKYKFNIYKVLEEAYKMSAFIVLGAQWGDEGKGKMTDYLAEEAEVVVRFQGGNNAGHTVEVGDKQYKDVYKRQ